MKAINLATMEELSFGNVTQEFAVAYGYCMENGRLSWFFDKVESKPDTWKKHLPLTYGEYSIGCGDWAAMLDQ